MGMGTAMGMVHVTQRRNAQKQAHTGMRHSNQRERTQKEREIMQKMHWALSVSVEKMITRNKKRDDTETERDQRRMVFVRGGERERERETKQEEARAGNHAR